MRSADRLALAPTLAAEGARCAALARATAQMVEGWVDAAQAAWHATECRRWRRASAAHQTEDGVQHFELVINVASMLRLSGRTTSPFVRASLHARGREADAGATAEATAGATPAALAASAAFTLCTAETGRIECASASAPEGEAREADAVPTPASQAAASTGLLTWNSAGGGLLRLAAAVRPRTLYELRLSMWDAAPNGSGA